MKSPARQDLLAKLFRGFGDPSRLSILLLLRAGPRRVSEVVRATGLSQPNASTHLSCLWDCGLVEREPRGRSVYYHIASTNVLQLIALAEEVLAASGERIECCSRYRASRPDKASSGRGRVGSRSPTIGAR